jgi:hypothetical protein
MAKITLKCEGKLIRPAAKPYIIAKGKGKVTTHGFEAYIA